MAPSRADARVMSSRCGTSALVDEDAALVERCVRPDVRRGLGVEVQVQQRLDPADEHEEQGAEEGRADQQGERGERQRAAQAE